MKAALLLWELVGIFNGWMMWVAMADGRYKLAAFAMAVVLLCAKMHTRILAKHPSDGRK